jgi:hypothetical protein
MEGQEVQIRDIILKFQENYLMILESLDDELKSMSYIIVDYYKKLEQAYLSLNDKDNAAKNHNEIIREIHKLGLQNSYMLIKRQCIYICKKCVNQDSDISLDEINKVYVLIKEYEL